MKKSKIFLLLFTFVLIIGMLSVTCFADSSNGIYFAGDVYTFNNTLSDIMLSADVFAEFSCSVDGETIYFSGFSYNGNVLTYYGFDGGVTVYNGQWVNEGYRTITFISFYDANADGDTAFLFLYLNGYDGYADTPIFYNFKDIIIKYVFGGNRPEYEAEIAVNLVCLVASLVVVFLPLLVILWLSRWVATLGRGAL